MIIQSDHQSSGYSEAYKYIWTAKATKSDEILKWKIQHCDTTENAHRNAEHSLYCPPEYQEGLEIAYLAKHDCCHKTKKVKSASNAGKQQGKELRNTSSFKATAALLKTNRDYSSTLLPSYKNPSCCTNKPSQNVIPHHNLPFQWSRWKVTTCDSQLHNIWGIFSSGLNTLKQVLHVKNTNSVE